MKLVYNSDNKSFSIISDLTKSFASESYNNSYNDSYKVKDICVEFAVLVKKLVRLTELELAAIYNRLDIYKGSKTALANALSCAAESINSHRLVDHIGKSYGYWVNFLVNHGIDPDHTHPDDLIDRSDNNNIKSYEDNINSLIKSIDKSDGLTLMKKLYPKDYMDSYDSYNDSY